MEAKALLTLLHPACQLLLRVLHWPGPLPALARGVLDLQPQMLWADLVHEGKFGQVRICGLQT